MQTELKILCYRFSDTASEQPPKESRAAYLMDKINGGGSLSREEKNYLTEKVRSNKISRRGICLSGWMFDFSPVLKRYLVNQRGYWYEVSATDKTAVRNMIYGHIHEIVEIGGV